MKIKPNNLMPVTELARCQRGEGAGGEALPRPKIGDRQTGRRDPLAAGEGEAVKSERTLKRQLAAHERRLTEQLFAIVRSEKGFGGPESYLFDELLAQRHALRYVLGLPHEAFHKVADWERWRTL